MSRCRGLIALITLVVLTAGLPIALYKFGGSPLPSRLPSLHQVVTALLHKDNGSLAIGAIRDVSWLAWFGFALSVLAEGQAAIRRCRAPRLHLGGLQGIACQLVAVAALTFAAPAVVMTAAPHARAATTQPTAPAAHSAQAESRSVKRVVIVRPGDCLWTIAEHYLGAGDKYPEIAQLNLGHEMSDGLVFTDPSLIQPGWRLILPAGATSAGSGHNGDGTSSTSGHRHRGHPSAQSGFSGPHLGAGHSGHGRSGQSQPGHGHSTSGRAGSGHPGAGSSPSRHTGSGHPPAGHPVSSRPVASRPASGPTGTASPGASAGGSRPMTAEVTLFLLGMVAGAALASIDRLRRRYRQSRALGDDTEFGARADGGDDEFDPAPESEPEPIGRQWPERPMDLHGPAGNRLPPGGLEPFDPAGPLSYAEPGFDEPRYDEPVYEVQDYQEPDYDELDRVPLADDRGPVSLLRAALLDLAASIARNGEELPPIVGIHLTDRSLEVLSSGQDPDAPGQPTTWTVELDGTAGKPAPPRAGELGDLLPGLFNAGVTDVGGDLLLDLEAMRVTSCDGPGDLADRLLAGAAVEFSSSQWNGWYDLVLVGCEDLDLAGRAEFSTDLDEAIDLLTARAQAVARLTDDGGPPDVRARRFTDPDNEDWGLTLLISRIKPTPAQMGRLLELEDGPGGAAALVFGDTQSDDGRLAPALYQVMPDDLDAGDGMTGTLSLAQLGPRHEITVRPRALTSAEYQALTHDSARPLAGDLVPDGIDEEPARSPELAAPWLRPVASPAPPADDNPVGPAEETGGHLKPGEAHRSLNTGPQHRPRHAAPDVRVQVLGSVRITGSAGALLPKQAELVLALALRSPAGLSGPELSSMLGRDAGHPLPGDEVRQLIAATCEALGQAGDGEEYIFDLGTDSYVPHEDLTLDWADFSFFGKRGRLARSRSDLRAALALVRGEPFADCYHWWIDTALIETIRAEIVETATMAARLELTTGDPEAASRAAQAGLLADPTAEQLWRELMRAEHEAGNLPGVSAAWNDCLDAIAEVAPGGEPGPDTEQLFRQLMLGAPIGSPR